MAEKKRIFYSLTKYFSNTFKFIEYNDIYYFKFYVYITANFLYQF